MAKDFRTNVEILGTLSTASVFTASNTAIVASLEVGTSASQKVTIFSGATNHNISIGRTDAVASTPYIDFHSSSVTKDFDTRIIAYGGASATTGQGTLSIVAQTASISGDLAVGSNSVLINKAPYAFARASSSVAVSSVGASVLPILTASVVDDPFGMIVGGSIVVPKAGVYHINGKWFNSAATASGYYDTFVYVNGAVTDGGFVRAMTGSALPWAAPVVNFYSRLAAGASLTLRGRTNVPGASTTVATGVISYLQAKWVSD